MTLPDELLQCVQRARDAVEQHSHHDLNPAYRVDIYAVMGPVVSPPYLPVLLHLTTREFKHILSEYLKCNEDALSDSFIDDFMPGAARYLGEGDNMEMLDLSLVEETFPPDWDPTNDEVELNRWLHEPDRSGQRRRAALASIIARNVLPLWERRWPTQRWPHLVLHVAERVLLQTIELKTARKLLYLCWEYCDSISVGMPDTGSLEDQFLRRIFVRALEAGSGEESGPYWDITYDVSDIGPDLEYDEHDTSYFAAAVYAGGPLWDSNSDATKRREFWTWWLDEAVPAAWNSVPPEQI